jgi:hypothetical protein
MRFSLFQIIAVRNAPQVSGKWLIVDSGDTRRTITAKLFSGSGLSKVRWQTRLVQVKRDRQI